MNKVSRTVVPPTVTLRARVWVEMWQISVRLRPMPTVTLRARVWVEMSHGERLVQDSSSHPPCEGVG